MIVEGKLPEDLSTANDDELFVTAPRILVATHIVPDITPSRVKSIVKSKSFINAFIQEYTNISAGAIESVAVMKDVFDDIWPIEDYKSYLHITPDELAKAIHDDRLYRYMQKIKRDEKKIHPVKDVTTEPRSDRLNYACNLTEDSSCQTKPQTTQPQRMTSLPCRTQ